MQKLHLTYNYFFLAVENGCTYQKMSVISRSSHWKFTFSIDKLCRFFFLRSFLQWRILKNWMQSTMQNHRKEKCWHNKEMGLELKMLSSIQRKCHEMNFKRNDNFLACLHTMPFWWNLRHLSSYKKVKIFCLHNFLLLFFSLSFFAEIDLPEDRVVSLASLAQPQKTKIWSTRLTLEKWLILYVNILVCCQPSKSCPFRTSFA